jgi:hypothetical protein
MTMTLPEIVEQVESEVATGRTPAAYRARLSRDPALLEAAKSVAKLMQHVREGSALARVRLCEALTTSDLASYASGMLIDREMLQNYDAMPKQWPKFLTRTTVKSFKPKYLSELYLGSQVFKDVPERTPYPMAQGPALGEYPIQVTKTGLLWGFSFEAQVNDDLDQLMMVPNQFPQMAVDTEDDRGLRVMINLDTGALNTAFFNVGNANIGTLVLNAENLQTVLTNLRTKRDPRTGAIIPAPRLQLVVGPALEFTAQQILATTQVQLADGSGGYAYAPNPLAGKVELVVNEKQIGTSWIVMPVPGTTIRAPFWQAFLQGYETPDFRQKADGGRSIGGGGDVVLTGSFDDDTLWYRGRQIVGAATGDPILTYGSDNTGL